MKKLLVLTIIFFICTITIGQTTPINRTTQKHKAYNEAANKLLLVSNSLEQVKRAFALGANPNIKRNSFGAPFIDAIESNSIEMVQSFLDNGANPNLYLYDINFGESTPLWTAIIKHNYNMVELLINAGADPNLAMKDGQTVLFWTVKYNTPNNIKLTKYLIKKGANINKIDNEGDTPLIVACKNGNFEIAQTLLDHGANPNISNNEMRKPLYFAFKSQNQNLINILLRVTKN
ncbi:MAG: ankyrin repeat and box protein [Firmicutes bacterium]|nr:ankyrin repeat and box protein [Bacillota bacterium]